MEDSRYVVNLVERVRDLLGDSTVAELDEVSYEWRQGYETLVAKRSGGGSLEYRGAYHPTGGCEGSGVCVYCGRTLEFD